MKQLSLGALLRSPFGRSLALILLVFTLAPVMALLALNTFITPVRLRERALTQMETVANLIQQSSARWLTAASEQLNVALSDAVTQQNAQFVLRATTAVERPERALLDKMATLLNGGFFSRVYLVRPDGTVALSTNTAYKGKSFGLDLSQFTDRTFWGFDRLPLTTLTTALAWQPVVDRQRELVGYLIGELDQEGLFRILEENRIGLGQTGEAYLLTAGRTGIETLTSLRFTSPGAGLNFDARVSEALQLGGDGFNGYYRNYQGQSVIGTVQRLETPVTGWLVVEQKESEALETLNTILQVTLIFTAVLTVLAVFAAVYTTGRIAQPLQSLSSAAQAMERGQLNTRVTVNRRDEFGMLGGSFNTMASGLERAFKDLETSNAELKQRAEQLQTITNVGQHATSFLELDRLLSSIVTEIQRDLGYRAVRLFLTEEQRLVLRATAGNPLPVEQEMKAAKRDEHGVALLSTKELLTGKSHIAIPLLVGANSRMIGTMDIQRADQRTFTRDEIEVLQILAGQIAIAIRNTELFAESEQARLSADEANRQKSEFLSNMSHELRTPLNVIIGYSHSILNRPAMYDNIPLPEVYRDGLHSIMAGGQHLLGLINDILDLSKIEAGQIDLSKDVIDPLPILGAVRQTAIGLVKKGVQVRAHYPSELPTILADELRVRQILLNLVSNAAKFTDQGFLTLDAKEQDGKLIFSVADTGIGIPEEVRPALFNRFQQGSREVLKKHGGTGLGLSISKQLTLLHGGDIWFESKVGQGSTFYFSIPLAPDKFDTQPKPLFRDSMEESGRVSVFDAEHREEIELAQQIVLFDAQSETRSRLQSALVAAGYDVLPVDDPERALMLATAMLPDAILLFLHADDTPAALGLEKSLRAEADLVNKPILALHEADTSTNSPAWTQPVIERLRDTLSSKTPVA